MEIKLTGQVVAGIFIKRLHRFGALVEIKGKEEYVFVPNSGRMKELLIPGAKVYLAHHGLPHRVTGYDLILVEHKDILVSIDSRLPNYFLAEIFKNFELPPFKGLISFKKEVAYGSSRLDFLLTFPEGLCYIEVKSVTLVEGTTARFPDAPTERGARHLEELIKAVGEGNRGAVIFLIQREDALTLEPNDATDPNFGKVLRKAIKSGVEAYAYLCKVSKRAVTFYKQVPVNV